MLYIAALALIHFKTGNVYLLTTFIQFPLPPPLASDHHKCDLFSYEFVCLFLKYNWTTTLCEFLVHNIVIRYFCTFQNDHCNKSSCHLSPYKDTTKLLTIFPTLYISYLWLIYFVIESLYLLISLTYLSSLSLPLPSGNHLFVLCISDSVTV